MGFMDELRKLTQPYDEDDDFFEGAEVGLREQPQVSAAQQTFEESFGAEPTAAPEPAPKPKPQKPAAEGGLFGGFKKGAPKGRAQRERTVNFAGSDQQVILFSPRSFDEAGELVNYLSLGRSVVMTLEGVPNDSARRLLDFLSGIAFALEGKITPISAKTYFVTPQNVDVLSPGSSGEQPESGGQSF